MQHEGATPCTCRTVRQAAAMAHCLDGKFRHTSSVTPTEGVKNDNVLQYNYRTTVQAVQ